MYNAVMPPCSWHPYHSRNSVPGTTRIVHAVRQQQYQQVANSSQQCYKAANLITKLASRCDQELSKLKARVRSYPDAQLNGILTTKLELKPGLAHRNSVLSTTALYMLCASSGTSRLPLGAKH
jgi:hypothetical protein